MVVNFIISLEDWHTESSFRAVNAKNLYSRHIRLIRCSALICTFVTLQVYVNQDATDASLV